MNNTNRVENDVAAQHLVRQSMAQAKIAPLVPANYAWAPATSTDATADENCYGWIISELRSGVDLDLEFSSLKFSEKVMVLDQIAAAFAAIQAVELPKGVTKFGALTYNPRGEIVSGEAAFLKAKPQDSYAAWRLARLAMEVQEAARSSVVQGWKRNGVGERIEKFVNIGGLEKILAGVDLHQKGLIHGDFSTYINTLLLGSRAIH